MARKPKNGPHPSGPFSKVCEHNPTSLGHFNYTDSRESRNNMGTVLVVKSQANLSS